jgi:hypothetical protein
MNKSQEMPRNISRGPMPIRKEDIRRPYAAQFRVVLTKGGKFICLEADRQPVSSGEAHR